MPRQDIHFVELKLDSVYGNTVSAIDDRQLQSLNVDLQKVDMGDAVIACEAVDSCDCDLVGYRVSFVDVLNYAIHERGVRRSIPLVVVKGQSPGFVTYSKVESEAVEPAFQPQVCDRVRLESIDRGCWIDAKDICGPVSFIGSHIEHDWVGLAGEVSTQEGDFSADMPGCVVVKPKSSSAKAEKREVELSKGWATGKVSPCIFDSGIDGPKHGAKSTASIEVVNNWNERKQGAPGVEPTRRPYWHAKPPILADGQAYSVGS